MNRPHVRGCDCDDCYEGRKILKALREGGHRCTAGCGRLLGKDDPDECVHCAPHNYCPECGSTLHRDHADVM